jgi:hypothetical protein
LKLDRLLGNENTAHPLKKLIVGLNPIMATVAVLLNRIAQLRASVGKRILMQLVLNEHRLMMTPRIGVYPWHSCIKYNAQSRQYIIRYHNPRYHNPGNPVTVSSYSSY